MPTTRMNHSSLAYYGQLSPLPWHGWDPLPCPHRAGLSVVSQSTGTRFPASCGSLHCPVCVRIGAWRFACAIGLAQPSRLILLTGGAEDWNENRDRLNRFRRAVRRGGRVYRDVAHIERNPRGDGTHLHIYSWGDALPLAVVRDAAVRAGFGTYANVEAVRMKVGSPLTYGVKTVWRGSNKGLIVPVDTQDFLDLNGAGLGTPPGRSGDGVQTDWLLAVVLHLNSPDITKATLDLGWSNLTRQRCRSTEAPPGSNTGPG